MRIEFWVQGARQLGRCPERDCAGVLLAVEDMGTWTWAQCSACLVQTGVGKRPLAPAGAKDEPARPDYSDDAFLGAS